MAFIKYRLDPQQWRLADEVMQVEASKPSPSRPAVSDVVNHISNNCFRNATKTPVFNAIKKRYETYFLGSLGPGEPRSSLVELGDTMMDLAAMKQLRYTPSELAEDVKNTYFKKSTSELHTCTAIETRYRTFFLKWGEADEMMKYAARLTDHPDTEFTIGVVVHYIKQTFFSADPSTTEDHIQDRYCRCWLGIVNTAAAVEAYDNERVAQQWSILPRESNTSQLPHQHNTVMEPAQPNASNALPLGFSSPPAGHQETSQNSSARLRQTVVGSTSLEMPPPASPSPLPCVRDASAPSSLNSHKRARGNSFDSNTTTSTSRYMGRSSYTNFSLPQLQRFQMQLRDSGFFSSSSASDTTSLISRMSRLSIEVKPCIMDHTLVDLRNSCPICRYPELQPKPRVYVAPEFAAPQRADVVDADEMDNGIMTRNANAMA